jgi:hypothetical protein
MLLIYKGRNGASVFLPAPEDGSGSSFQNVVFFSI